LTTTIGGSYPSVNSDSDATINGLTVGRGTGAIATNTAVGASALNANTTGSNNAAFGSSAGSGITTGSYNTAIGRATMSSTATSSGNTVVGYASGNSITSGSDNTFIGGGGGTGVYGAGQFNTTGSFNTAVGTAALTSNTTASNNTAVGYQALYSNTTASSNTAVGYLAGYSQTTGGGVGGQNVFVGQQAGSNVVAFSRNTCVGYQAGNGTTTADRVTAIGHAAGNINTGGFNCFVGGASGLNNTSGTNNNFFGDSSGFLVTTGSKNTIIGGYSGNQGGLDIRTASNRVVLSDGDGNPYAYWGSTGQATLRAVGVDNLFTLTSSAAAFSSRIQLDCTGGGGGVLAATANILTCQTGGTGGVSLNAGATAWVSASDERVKENLQEITGAANKIASLRAVTGNYTWDESKKSRAFLIAQDVLEVLPEAVETKNPDELGLAYTDVIPLLVAAIKELKAEIDLLKGN
jgi:trimeric autotransporter adhesin